MNTHHHNDENRLGRRGFFRAGLLGAATAGLVNVSRAPAAVNETVKADRPLRVVRIDRTTVKIPFRKIPARNMARELPHWEYSEIVEVHLKSGHAGFGETLLYYTWGATTDEDVKRAQGKNAAELMWDDSLGAGLQIALFDAVARAADVPIHHLLGHKVHDRTPLSWWNIETSPADMAAECKQAYRQGYMAYKTKGRPWVDVWQQVAASSKVVPKEFKIDLDFNDTLLDAERGILILKELEAYPNVDIFETPIPQHDIAGNQAIRNATDVSVAMHYGKPDPLRVSNRRKFGTTGPSPRVVHPLCCRSAIVASADETRFGFEWMASTTIRLLHYV